jgi:hypothetical protein
MMQIQRIGSRIETRANTGKRKIEVKLIEVGSNTSKRDTTLIDFNSHFPHFNHRYIHTIQVNKKVEKKRVKEVFYACDKLEK